MSQFEFEEDLPVLGPLEASDIKRGICRHMRNLNYSVLVEFRLKSKRRVDVMGLDRNGKFAIVEIKSSSFISIKSWSNFISDFLIDVANAELIVFSKSLIDVIIFIFLNCLLF